MSRSVLSSREVAVWAACFVVVASLLVVTRFTSDDPDSALYASISGRLTQLPPARWIAPEWWGYWNGTGLFVEHPAGVFLLPTALGRLGLPAEQAAYVVGVGAGLSALVLIGVLINRLTSREDARAALVLLQIMPVAFLFRIRANHEYPMLVCLLLTLVGLDGVRRSWGWLSLVALGLTGALLIKGAFVVLILLAAGLWIGLNPTRTSGSVGRPVVACLVSLAVMAVTAVAYDAAYRHATGVTFWGPYWRRQLAPVTIATPIGSASTLARHLVFYVIRLLWHPLPWSLALLVALWQRRHRLTSVWRTMPSGARRGLVFAASYTGLAVALLSPSNRFAERYAFSAAYVVGAAGAVVAYRTWPTLVRRLAWLEAQIPAFPAWLWLLLIVLRLALGPFLPRISLV
jgi:4-amino-4-deoxy-L-arabinose transferase-like glycosyltransferase